MVTLVVTNPSYAFLRREAIRVSSRSRRHSPIEMERILIPPGPYLAGPDDENLKIPRFLEAQSLTKLELPAFYIGKTPVTNAEYATFVTATGHEPPEHWSGSSPPEGLIDHPVVHVTWFDASAFAAWAGGRLLSLEEWEKAARGTDGRRFPWGEWAEGRCNSKAAGIGRTTPVGRFSPAGDSPYGCVDMVGNVQEWTGSGSGKYKVLRGGAFNHREEILQTFYAARHVPTYHYENIGFRVG